MIDAMVMGSFQHPVIFAETSGSFERSLIQKPEAAAIKWLLQKSCHDSEGGHHS